MQIDFYYECVCTRYKIKSLIMSYRLFDIVIGNGGLIEEEKKKMLATSYISRIT